MKTPRISLLKSIKNVFAFCISTKVLSFVLLFCLIFVVHNNLTKYNVRLSNDIQELTDRRTGESPVNTSKCTFCRLLCSHLSGNCSNFKTIDMHNNLQKNSNNELSSLVFPGKTNFTIFYNDPLEESAFVRLERLLNSRSRNRNSHSDKRQFFLNANFNMN